jgi:hypothetical protein
MKNLILSAIFVVAAFLSNAQIVTITAFQTTNNFGFPPSTPAQILQDNTYETASTEYPNTFSYEIDFTRKICILKNDGNSEVTRVGFVVKNKKSNRDFEIEFTDPNDEFDNTYGIVVSNNTAAYFENNGRLIELIVFKSFTIF